MEPVGTIHSLWRYPIKSMGGESVPTLAVLPNGIAGDRRLAFESDGAPRGKPKLTGAERAAMLRCHARFTGDAADAVEVTTGKGERFCATDPALIAALQSGLETKHRMWLKQSEQPMTDCRPIALLSIQTLDQLGRELGMAVAAERFRANILLDLSATSGFGEDHFVGGTLQIGSTVQLAVKERDPRCRIITLDPVSGAMLPALMTRLARHHDGRAGIYAVTVQPGRIAEGDPVWLLR